MCLLIKMIIKIMFFFMILLIVTFYPVPFFRHFIQCVSAIENQDREIEKKCLILLQ